MVLSTTLEAVQTILPDYDEEVQRTVNDYINGDMTVCNPRAIIEFYRRFSDVVQFPPTVGAEWTHISGADAQEWLAKECENDAFRLYCYMHKRSVYVRDDDFVKHGHPGVPFYTESLAPMHNIKFDYELTEMREICGDTDTYLNCTGVETDSGSRCATNFIWKMNIFHLMIANSPKAQVKRDPLRDEEKLLQLLNFDEHDWRDFHENRYTGISKSGRAILRGWYHLCGHEAPMWCTT